MKKVYFDTNTTPNARYMERNKEVQLGFVVFFWNVILNFCWNMFYVVPLILPLLKSTEAVLI